MVNHIVNRLAVEDQDEGFLLHDDIKNNDILKPCKLVSS